MVWKTPGGKLNHAGSQMEIPSPGSGSQNPAISLNGAFRDGKRTGIKDHQHPENIFAFTSVQVGGPRGSASDSVIGQSRSELGKAVTPTFTDRLAASDTQARWCRPGQCRGLDGPHLPLADLCPCPSRGQGEGVWPEALR